MNDKIIDSALIVLAILALIGFCYFMKVHTPEVHNNSMNDIANNALIINRLVK